MLQKKDKESILFFDKTTFKIVKLIFNYPTKVFHIREIERKTKLSTTAIKSALEKLQNFKIINIEKTPITTNIKADLNSKSYRFYKMTFNLYRLNKYNLISNLVGFFNIPETIVLFGSFAKGEDIEESDIDILIITSNKPSKNITKWTEIIEKEMNRNINFHILPSLNKSEPAFKNSVSNGIVLHGYLKIV